MNPLIDDDHTKEKRSRSLLALSNLQSAQYIIKASGGEASSHLAPLLSSVYPPSPTVNLRPYTVKFTVVGGYE